MHFVAGRERSGERVGLVSVDEDADVRSDTLLLVDHAKPHAWMGELECREHFAKRVAFGTDLRGSGGVGA